VTTVIDASVAIAALSPDEASSDAARIVDDCLANGAVVPPNWPLEIANVLLVKQRRRIMEPAIADEALDAIIGISASVDDASDERLLRRTKRLAEKHGLSCYDAAYLELAIRRALPLATLDGKLADAARREGLQVLPDGGAR
jgi:predicted nucleic acid-binding protein